MNDNNEHDYFRCTFIAESPKALHVKLDHNAMDYWVPKSLCDAKKEAPDSFEGILEVESWFAEKEGMAK